MDEDGKSSIVCEKGGKTLKSVPSRFKKNETVLRYQEVHKQLKDQYSRTRQMMEQAMEDRTVFEAWELLELQENPVAGPIVTPLVLLRADQADREPGLSGEQQEAALGLLTREGLVDWTGTITPVQEDTGFLIAHPWDLYEKDCWHQYQRLLFEKQIRQPFKQVFRELYVKLEEELEKTESAMFAGNQIQPKKTAGTLRTRRWVADYEDGLQKVYYRENIVARIYAMADWFSPSDIEAPTLEAVVFYDRKSMKPLRIREIPDVIYSEVMRDVDLAVSTAHAGGVDPETSRSTVEMRSAIIQCSLELFRLKNVRLEKTHAFIDGKLGQSCPSDGKCHGICGARPLPAPGTDLPSLCGRRSEDGGDPVKDPAVCRRRPDQGSRDPVPDPLTGRQLLAVLFVFFLEILPPLFTVGAFL